MGFRTVDELEIYRFDPTDEAYVPWMEVTDLPDALETLGRHNEPGHYRVLDISEKVHASVTIHDPDAPDRSPASARGEQKGEELAEAFTDWLTSKLRSDTRRE